MRNFKVVSEWYNKERMKDYQVRDYGEGQEVWVCLFPVGWFKSEDINPEDLIEGSVWEQAAMNSST